NDVRSTLHPEFENHYYTQWQLPQKPDLAWYEENLSGMIQDLRSGTAAPIAILSLPVIGEDLDSHANDVVRKYSDRIKIIANQENVTYLPLFEKQVEALKEQALHIHSENAGESSKGKDVGSRNGVRIDCASPNTLMQQAVARHY